MRAASKQASGRAPDWTAVLVIAVACLLYPHVRDATVRAGCVLREVTELWVRYMVLAAENYRLKQLAELAATRQGREMLARGREGLVPEDAILVRVTERPPRPVVREGRFSRAIRELGLRAAELRITLTRSLWLLSQAHNPHFPENQVLHY